MLVIPGQRWRTRFRGCSHLCFLQRYVCARYWPLWPRNYLQSYWWNEGQGWQRRSLTIRCYVGCSGCGWEGNCIIIYELLTTVCFYRWRLSASPPFTSSSGLLVATEPRPQDLELSLPWELWLVLVWRLDVSRIAPLSQVTAPERREVAVVAGFKCQTDFCFSFYIYWGWNKYLNNEFANGLGRNVIPD